MTHELDLTGFFEQYKKHLLKERAALKRRTQVADKPKPKRMLEL